MAPRADDDTLIGKLTNGLIAAEKTIASILDGQRALLELSKFQKDDIKELKERIDNLEKKTYNE